MLGALVVVAGIAIVDSLNPATVGPALVLTMSSHPTRRVLEFAAGFFVVNVAGGILLVLGPGSWLLSLIPHPSPHAKHLLFIVGGAALLAAALALVLLRRRLVKAEGTEPGPRRRSGSAFATGAGLAAAELPTAFPYFAAVAAISAADLPVAEEIILVLVFNVLFLAPIVAIAIVVGVFPSLRQTVIEPVRRWVSRHWPIMTAAILGVAGAVLVVLGAVGLA